MQQSTHGDLINQMLARVRERRTRRTSIDYWLVDFFFLTTDFLPLLPLWCRTSYDKDEKKHWLQVQKGPLEGRYMLQDNAKPAWQDDSSKTSLPEKIVHAVDSMIDRIIEQDAGKTTGSKTKN